MNEGPICQSTNDRVIRESGLGRNLKVGDLAASGSFAWPFPNCIGLLDLQNKPRPQLVGGPDGLLWLPHGRDFSVRVAWDSFREKGREVSWAKIVWKHPIIPRCSFITWLAFKGKLLTLDKLKHRGVNLANRCPLCLEQEEDLMHILSTCKFSKDVWEKFRGKFARLPHESNWEDWLRWVSDNFKGKKDKDKVGRLTICSIVYQLWKERNARIHGLSTRSSLFMHGDICDMLDLMQVPGSL